MTNQTVPNVLNLTSMTATLNETPTTAKASKPNKALHTNDLRRVTFALGVKKLSSKSDTIQSDSCVALRAKQVEEMIAGKRFKTNNLPWTPPSSSVFDLWKKRHPSYQQFSNQYMASQRRMLVLADVDPPLRFELFESLCYHRCLAPTTAETYWTTWLGVQKALMIKPCDADARTTKLLKARSTAYPVQFPQPATLAEIELIVKTFRAQYPSITAIVMMSFILGQRISDAIQLATADLTEGKEFLQITVRRGKTIGVSQPYTLWLRRNVYPTESIIELKNHARHRQRLFLLTELNSEEERQEVLSIVRDMITSINDELELRSIRRGGLQRMARSSPTQVVLHHSRHSDEKMLMRYLGWGAAALHQQKDMIEAVDSITDEMTIKE